jgi:hypothetical protein
LPGPARTLLEHDSGWRYHGNTCSVDSVALDAEPRPELGSPLAHSHQPEVAAVLRGFQYGRIDPTAIIHDPQA